MVETTIDATAWLRKQLELASPDLLRAMVQEFAEALMGADVDALCGAGHGERSPERVNLSGFTKSGRGGYFRAPDLKEHDGPSCCSLC